MHANHYLQAMGIERWQQRLPLPGAAVDESLQFTTYLLINEAGERAAVLGCQDLPVEVGQEAAVRKLLDAMLAAIKLRCVPIAADAVPAGVGVVLLMGPELAQQALGRMEDLDTLRQGNVHSLASGSKVVVTYHPRDLLQQAEHKAKAWEDLKKLKALL
jgi:hypothetical protein